MALGERDEPLMTYNLRRFCERTDELLDATAFASLARFYRSLPHTAASQSKYDLVVTRLFTATSEGERRVLRLSREALAARLTEM